MLWISNKAFPLFLFVYITADYNLCDDALNFYVAICISMITCNRCENLTRDGTETAVCSERQNNAGSGHAAVSVTIHQGGNNLIELKAGFSCALLSLLTSSVWKHICLVEFTLVFFDSKRVLHKNVSFIYLLFNISIIINID